MPPPPKHSHIWPWSLTSDLENSFDNVHSHGQYWQVYRNPTAKYRDISSLLTDGQCTDDRTDDLQHTASAADSLDGAKQGWRKIMGGQLQYLPMPGNRRLRRGNCSIEFVRYKLLLMRLVLLCCRLSGTWISPSTFLPRDLCFQFNASPVSYLVLVFPL